MNDFGEQVMRVLVADDRKTTRFVLNKNLIKLGYEVIEASNGEEAWNILNTDSPPRIAVLDWMMPGINGVEICKKLGERKDGPFIYTILLTSKTEKEDLVYALDNGAHNFQSKPITAEEIRSHVNVGRRLVEADDKLKEYAAERERYAVEREQYAAAMKTHAEEMERLATIDSLTGAFNRRYFMDHGERELRRALRYERSMSVMIMDIDHFKKVNDTYGHAAGDLTLKIMSDACLKALRESDLFGRLGGEEFGAILPENDVVPANLVAERIRQTLESLEVSFENNVIHFTVSIGVTMVYPGDKSIEIALNRADKALYEAKNNGRNLVVVG